MSIEVINLNPSFGSSAVPNSIFLWILAYAAVGALVVAAFIVVRARARARARGLAGVLPLASPPESLAELIPESRYLALDKLATRRGSPTTAPRIHFVQAGEGPDVVLLHGIGASVYIWRYLFPILQTRHRVTAFDFFGFGKSSKDAQLKFTLDSQAESIALALTELGIEKAMLVGSSMGGAIALWMAKRWPERFESVVALGPATDSGRVPLLTQHFAITAPLFRRTVNKHSIKLILNYVVANRNLITDEVVERYLEPFRDHGESLRALVAATSVLNDRRLPRGLADLRAKTLVIWGANDYLVPRKSMTKLADVLKNARFIYHPTGGHHIMEDEPVWLARKLELFASGADLTGDEFGD